MLVRVDWYIDIAAEISRILSSSDFGPRSDFLYLSLNPVQASVRNHRILMDDTLIFEASSMKFVAKFSRLDTSSPRTSAFLDLFFPNPFSDSPK